MDLNRVKDLTENIRSIKNAKFYQPNWAFIGFTSEFTSAARMKVIRTAPLSEYHTQMMLDLNNAIAPVLEKYELIFEEELRKEIGHA